RTLDGAVKVAPHGARATEAALAAARARADLWEVSRSRTDARAALAAFRRVDEDYPGPVGAEALASAVRLAARAKETKERAAPGQPMRGPRRLRTKAPPSRKRRQIPRRAPLRSSAR